MKIYISGKISGIEPDVAKRHFEFAEFDLLSLGHNPVNPMKILPYAPEHSWADYMVADIREIFSCEAMYMLNNWQDSKGARIEHAIARELDLKIIYE